MTDAGLLAALGIVSSCVLLLGWIIKFMFMKLLPAMENNNKLTEEGNKLTKANTKATTTADIYLRERNGRDNEHHEATLKAIKKIPTVLQEIADSQAASIIKAVGKGTQHLDKQVVDKQIVNSQE